ncbi:hypothetical protein I6F26_11765 [Ensifer sp. IC3342]|nr:hypothetical protein [Ensifer sp. BRP08]MCA1447251.1 hypothetical protein [Ensifer sp. IC3342]
MKDEIKARVQQSLKEGGIGEIALDCFRAGRQSGGKSDIDQHKLRQPAEVVGQRMSKTTPQKTARAHLARAEDTE